MNNYLRTEDNKMPIKIPEVRNAVNFIYWALFNTICILPLILWSCCKRCFKKRQIKAEHDKPLTSTSLDDVKSAKEKKEE